MASERYVVLAAELAKGTDPVAAMVAAGWPADRAKGLGAMAFRLCDKAGVPVVLTKGAHVAQQVDPGAGLDVPEHDPSDSPRRGRPKAEIKEN